MKKLKITRRRWPNRLVAVLVVCILSFIGVHLMTASHADPLSGVSLGNPYLSYDIVDDTQGFLSAQLNLPREPSSSLYPSPDFTTSCGVYDSSTSCLSTTLDAINNARQVIDGLPPLSFDIDTYASLSEPQQLFVIANLERVAHGLLPATALSNQLNGFAQTGADHNADPVFPNWSDTGTNPMTGGPSAVEIGSNYADYTTNTLAADYYWMYFDGPGVNGMASIVKGCTAADKIPPCWAHRENILTSYTKYTNCSDANVYMGAAAASGGRYAEIFVGACGTLSASDNSYSWATAESQINNPPSNNPATAPPVITSLGSYSGASTGHVTVTIHGSNFESNNTRVKFGRVSAATVSVKSNTKIKVTTPANQTCGKTVSVKVITNAGTSNTKSYKYTCS